MKIRSTGPCPSLVHGIITAMSLALALSCASTAGGADDFQDDAGADNGHADPGPPPPPFLEMGLVIPENGIPCTPIDTGVPQNDCNHHGSSILVLPDGTVAVVWYTGIREKSKDSRIVWARMPPGSDEFGPWEVLFDHPDLAEGNPVLWRSELTGNLHLFFVTIEDESWNDAIVRMMTSADDGATWGEPKTLRSDWHWMVRNKPIRLPSGELFLPCYDETLYVPTFLVSSDDFASKWTEIVFEDDLLRHLNSIQPSVIVRDDESLFAIMRNTASNDPQTAWEMTSADGGRTWTPNELGPIPNYNASNEMIRLASGAVVVTFNNSTTGRYPLAAALSDDEGRTWSAVANIREDCPDGDCNYGYPSVAQDPTDGSLWFSYTHGRRSIGWVHTNEAWIREKGDSFVVD